MARRGCKGLRRALKLAGLTKSRVLKLEGGVTKPVVVQAALLTFLGLPTLEQRRILVELNLWQGSHQDLLDEEIDRGAGVTRRVNHHEQPGVVGDNHRGETCG